jgi:hypothetical protein
VVLTRPQTTMPPAKKAVIEDSRSDASTVRERQIAAAAHARKSKQNAAAAAAAARDNGSALKELAAYSAEAGNAGQAPGVSFTVHAIRAGYPLGNETQEANVCTDVMEYDSTVSTQYIPGLAQSLDTGGFHITTQPSAAGKSWDWTTVAYDG